MAFRPLTAQNSYGQNIGQINDVTRQLNKEQVTKVYKGPNNTNAITIGKYGEGYGFLQANTSGEKHILLGQAPNDGREGLWIISDGYDVIQDLNS